MSGSVETLGIIAGNRSLPLLLARQARSMGVKRLVAVGFEGETEGALEGLVNRMVWVRVGQLGKMIAAFKENGVRECVMAGQIAPRNLWDVRPDLRGVGLLLGLKERNAHTIFGGIAEELRKDGIELIDGLRWLGPLMAQKGFALGPGLSEEQKADVEFGLGIAKEVSRLEIGQCVVVKGGTVLAVEGFEGTDECLRRGGSLAGKAGGAVAVKVAKEKHDMRFDIPCVGLRTVEVCAEFGVAVLALEAGRTLVLDEGEVSELTRRRKVSVVAV